ncbi:NIPSNAP family protein [Sinobaca sp. H24]|uniref:NIPSNAP family protein n=1 Tax=Sinobaca sp. H24 TaxID=2923376 RepID=UPI002079F996|nr:NIPSNAP family protein [Sinobaca sp. H24]
MFYEMRTYTVKVGKVNEYLDHFEEVGFPIISKYAKLVGWWYTDIGELNQVIHIWEYESLDVRKEKRKQLYEDKDWTEKFVPKAFDMLEKQESKMLYAASFSPIK